MTQDQSSRPGVFEVTVGALLHDIGKLIQRGSSRELALPRREKSSDTLQTFNGRHSRWHALWTEAFFNWVDEQRLPWPKDVDARWIRDFAVYHHHSLQERPHAPRHSLNELVAIADQLASGFEPKEMDTEGESTEAGRNKFKRTPLKAIVPSLSLDRKSDLIGHYVPDLLDADALMPRSGLEGLQIENAVSAAYCKMWESFKDEWKTLCQRSGISIRTFEEGLLSVMERTLWAIPSSPTAEPDVSLFDHSRTVAAFAAALFQHHNWTGDLDVSDALKDETRSKFRFLVGDLSGIQSTLFQFSRERLSGLNRILRGRSLRFQFIADSAVRQVLEAFEMPFCAAMQTAGGRFLILLPDLGCEETHKRTDSLKTRFDEWLVRNYTGNLGFGLALSDPISVRDLKSAREDHRRQGIESRGHDVRSHLTIATEMAKLRQLEGPAADGILSVDYPHGVCGSCGKRPATSGNTESDADPEGAYCSTCREESDLGRRLPKSRVVAITPVSSDTKGGIFGLKYELKNKGSDNDFGWRTGTESASGPPPVRLGQCYVPVFDEKDVEEFKGLDGHTDINEGGIKTFEVLAKYSVHNEGDTGQVRGREMLAVLKADVDRLGSLFGRGLGGEFHWNPARSSALSRMVDGYFSIRIPHILKEEFSNIYTVYAGGDDLFILGPWPDIFGFASRLHEDFSAFSLGNPEVTISAGIALFDARSPVQTAAHEAEERLVQAKECRPDDDDPPSDLPAHEAEERLVQAKAAGFGTGKQLAHAESKTGRNRISVIEHGPIEWERYDQALSNAKGLDRFVKEGTLSTSALYRFLALSDAATRCQSDQAQPTDYAWRARLGYTLARSLPKHQTCARQSEAFSLVTSLFGLDKGLLQANHAGHAGARLSLSYAIYLNR